MPYFQKLRERETRFYQRMWQELSEMRVIDTHEHFDNIAIWKKNCTQADGSWHMTIPDALDRSYIHIKHAGGYTGWAKELLQHRGTGYLRAWQIAMEDLHGLEAGPITPRYLEEMEKRLNEAYKDDVERQTYTYLRHVLEDRMHVEKAILNVGLDSHCEYPQPWCQGAAGIPGILDGITVPKGASAGMPQQPVYWYAKTKLGMDLKSIQTLDDYCDVTERLLKYLKDSGNYVCI
nr:hypothetical protein [Candidatus Sigynarchaeota archaeon]